MLLKYDADKNTKAKLANSTEIRSLAFLFSSAAYFHSNPEGLCKVKFENLSV